MDVNMVGLFEREVYLIVIANSNDVDRNEHH